MLFIINTLSLFRKDGDGLTFGPCLMSLSCSSLVIGSPDGLGLPDQTYLDFVERRVVPPFKRSRSILLVPTKLGSPVRV